jgi:hypothetical protein
MQNTSLPRRRYAGEDMRSALNRVGTAIDRWYERRCRRQATIEKLAAGPPWYHIVQTAAPQGAFFMELTNV